jgi:hypothetical protein
VLLSARSAERLAKAIEQATGTLYDVSVGYTLDELLGTDGFASVEVLAAAGLPESVIRMRRPDWIPPNHDSEVGDLEGL